MSNKELAELLYPNVKYDIEYLEKKYPERNLPEGAEVCRFAPSPTGRMHMGNLFASFIPEVIAKQSNGVFILRIEDTDDKRAIENGVELILQDLEHYNYVVNEHPIKGGEYGPYIQTERKEIYHIVAKYLVSIGRAYPCFCTEEDLSIMREKQEHRKTRIGYYGKWAKCRNLTYDEIKQKIDNGEKWVLRLKSMGDFNKKIIFKDLVKGTIELPENDIDQVLIKSDGIPPYAFAHAIDDTLMGTTIVVRGEEYISSTPAHMEIFDALGFDYVTYCHNPLICKIGDEGNRRKISKRYDPEADMRFYFDVGYPIESVLEYLLNLINSGFENWRKENPDLSWTEFKFGVNDITAVAPIFDLVKLNDISKNLISRMKAIDVYSETLKWAQDNDKEFAKVLTDNKDLAIKALNIDREIERPRKDIAKYSDVKDLYTYFFNEIFDKNELVNFDSKFSKETLKEFIQEYLNSLNLNVQKDEWFNGIKEVAGRCGFALDNKAYKANPEEFKGNVADACSIIRVALTGRNQTPDLYSIMLTLGEKEVKDRLNYVLNKIA